MNTYLALLRGINVGGNGMIRMGELREALAASGLSDVRTYIQSGNVIFSSNISDTDKLAAHITSCIEDRFKLTVKVVVFSSAEWQQIIKSAPKWWGVDKTWKHNLLIMIKPFVMSEVVAAIGTLKPNIEAIEPGAGVLYQSMSLTTFGRTTSSKLISNPIYKNMTIRNYNTSVKLAALLKSENQEIF